MCIGRAGATLGTLAVIGVLSTSPAVHATTRSEAAVLDALSGNPGAAEPQGPLRRWDDEIDLRYYGTCELRESTDGPRIDSLSKVVAEINSLGVDLKIRLSVSNCDTDDIKPRSEMIFGIAVVVGGDVPRVMQILELGQSGDGSEFVATSVHSQGESFVSSGCVSNIGGRQGSGKISAGVIYVDPAAMADNTQLCIKAALLGTLGFIAQPMRKYPDSLLAFTTDEANLPSIDRCLIAMLYSTEFADRMLYSEEFRSKLPDLASRSQFCR